MSFDLVCSTCGAPSSPSIGTCPYCKTIMVTSKGGKKPSPIMKELKTLYNNGKLARALELSGTMAQQNPKLLENVNFLILISKILLETEGPTSKIKSMLGKAYLLDPTNSEVHDYLEITNAKKLLSNIKDDLGEKKLKEILIRSPHNPHALFILGSHLFWIENDYNHAIRYLEECVKNHSTFLRAWGCLGALYAKIGQSTLANRSFRKCIALEQDPKMKEFFKKQLVV